MHRYRRAVDDGRAVEVDVKDTENAVADVTSNKLRNDGNISTARILDREGKAISYHYLQYQPIWCLVEGGEI